MSNQSGLSGLPAARDRQRPGHLFRVQSGHLVRWSNTVSAHPDEQLSALAVRALTHTPIVSFQIQHHNESVSIRGGQHL